ncbi:hypothetical protein AGIG_G6508 [Arapaima gigas]
MTSSTSWCASTDFPTTSTDYPLPRSDRETLRHVALAVAAIGDAAPRTLSWVRCGAGTTRSGPPGQLVDPGMTGDLSFVWVQNF